MKKLLRPGCSLPDPMHWGSSGYSLDLQLDLVPLLGRQRKGGIKREGKEGKGKLWKGRKGELTSKGWTGFAIPEMQLPQTSLVGYVR